MHSWRDTQEKGRNDRCSEACHVWILLSRCWPKLDVFRKRIKAVKGCPGADGWSKEEILAISRNKVLAKMVWDSMELWEQMGVSPSAVSHCKLIMVPKKEHLSLSPSAFRPIAVQSAFWRAWSSTWLRSCWITNWAQETFPPNVSGGIPGSLGAETMAAVLDYDLSAKRHAVSLDLKHAFDSVHLSLLEEVMLCLFPKANRRWIKLLFGHWHKMKRWVMLDSHVCESPLNPSSGLPQGDPLSPLIMLVLMHALQLIVEARLQDEQLRHFIYMDDRTVVAGSKEMVNKAQSTWKLVAEEYHLIENPDKAQFVDLTKKFGSFEVLGALLGCPNGGDILRSKAVARLQKSSELYRKIRFLPESYEQRMKDSNVFGRGIIGYGWISHGPNPKRIRMHLTELWRCLGRTQFSAVNMRKVIAGASMHLCITALMRQIRLLHFRNKAIANMYSVDILLTEFSTLEEMVTQGLIDLGWSKDERFGRWSHALFPEGFDFEEVGEPSKWKKIAHEIRESYRFLAFEDHKNSTRHEVVGQDVG